MRTIRLWPGVVLAVLVVLFRWVVPLFAPDYSGVGLLVAMAGTALILLWWLFFSRVPWLERLGALLLVALGVVAARPFLDPSIAGGMMGMMFAVYSVPSTMTLAFVAWAAATRRLKAPARWAGLVVAIVIGCGVWMLVRTEGVTGGGASQLAWRWTPTPEQRLLAQAPEEPVVIVPEKPKAAPVAEAVAKPAAADEPAEPVPPPVPAKAPDWAGFRGANRDGAIRGVRIETDWTASPPREMWRRRVGPGWSSFAVDGDRFYTQEQRGSHEVVSCYRLSTGEPIWRYTDPVRFWESNGGAGPRATPTLRDGRIYTFGATGILNVLDARTGQAIWSRNVATDTNTKVPMWGFSSSPLVLDDLVVVAAAGRLAAYGLVTGRPRWQAADGGGYSSPQLVTIDGVPQIVLLTTSGAVAVAPADGKTLWQHSWEGTPIVQPGVIGGDLLLASGDMMGGMGMRRIGITHAAREWKAEERWTSRGLKPYFNDYVIHDGHAYGFDGAILSCIDLENGERKWKGGRYGQGQMLLLPEQDVLLVLSEDGELALVSATPDGFRELSRMKAIEGKTWNHPVLVGHTLLVRNGEEMAAFELR